MTDSHAQYRPKRLGTLHGFVGVGLGQEHLLSLPKVSAIYSLGFKQNRRFKFRSSRLPFSGIHDLPENGLLFGTEVSMFVLFAGTFSTSALIGIKSGPVTAETSITRQFLASPDGDIVARQSTLNPKLGVKMGPIWLKTGPSFLLGSEDVYGSIFGDFLKIGGTAFNVELSYQFSRQ